MTRISAEMLLKAYRLGLFPMADSRHSDTLYWLDPRRRGIIPLDAFRVSRRLARTLRQDRFEVSVDRDFDAVIQACARPRADGGDTWINDDILRLYRELAEQGAAHSVECWREGRLAGGLYGVSVGGAFFGESMFSRVRDASKVALVHLAARLVGAGYRLLDTQFLTPHLALFGAVEISRGEYRRRLGEALQVEAALPRELDRGALLGFLARARLRPLPSEPTARCP